MPPPEKYSWLPTAGQTGTCEPAVASLYLVNSASVALLVRSPLTAMNGMSFDVELISWICSGSCGFTCGSAMFANENVALSLPGTRVSAKSAVRCSPSATWPNVR